MSSGSALLATALASLLLAPPARANPASAKPDGARVGPADGGAEPDGTEPDGGEPEDDGVLARGAGRPGARGLHVSWKLDGAVTLGAGGLALALASPRLAPTQCRMCGAGLLDTEVREALQITNPVEALRARRASDALVSGVLPAGALAVSGLLAREDGTGWGGAGANALVITEALGLAAVLNGTAKDAFARSRPAGGDALQPGARNRSFYSGHTSTAFSLAVATGTVASLRGSEAAPWIWATGLTLATGVGYLRIAGDAHWASDVLVGAGMGAGVGFLVPWLHRGPGGPGLEVVPAPAGRGLALRVTTP